MSAIADTHGTRKINYAAARAPRHFGYGSDGRRTSEPFAALKQGNHEVPVGELI